MTDDCPLIDDNTEIRRFHTFIAVFSYPLSAYDSLHLSVFRNITILSTHSEADTLGDGDIAFILIREIRYVRN